MKTLTKEQIIEVLNKYHDWMENEFEYPVYSRHYIEDFASELESLQEDKPTDEEIEKMFPTDIEVIKKNEYSFDINSVRTINLLKQEGAKAMRDGKITHKE